MDGTEASPVNHQTVFLAFGFVGRVRVKIIRCRATVGDISQLR